jgi:chromosomal replication initiation ATPase DnaA
MRKAIINSDEDVKKVAMYVCESTGVSLVDLYRKDGKKGARDSEVALSRWIAMYLSELTTNSSGKFIANHFSGRNHSTVIYAREQLESMMDTDKNLKIKVLQILARLNKEAEEKLKNLQAYSDNLDVLRELRTQL